MCHFCVQNFEYDLLCVPLFYWQFTSVSKCWYPAVFGTGISFYNSLKCPFVNFISSEMRLDLLQDVFKFTENNFNWKILNWLALAPLIFEHRKSIFNYHHSQVDSTSFMSLGMCRSKPLSHGLTMDICQQLISKKYFGQIEMGSLTSLK